MDRTAVAEVSNHNEPIGRGCVALVWKSIDVRLTQVADQVAWLSTDFDCHLIWGLLVHRSFRFKWVGCQLFWDWSDLLSTNLKFKWLGCELIWDSDWIDSGCHCFEIEVQKRSISARLPSKMKLWRPKTKHFCETSFKHDILTARLTSEFQYV